MPPLYIVLVNYNGYEDTLECINSLMKNSYTDFKVVVVDNASTDGSGQKLAQKFAGSKVVTVILNDDNLGFSGGNNVGISYSMQQGADLVVLLNNDTIAKKDFLESIARYYNKNRKKPILFTGKILYYYEPDRIWYGGGSYKYYKGSVVHRHFNEIDVGQCNSQEKINFICGCLLCINRKALNQIGLLPEEYFLYCEDTAYTLKAVENGIDCYFEPSIVVYHKVSASTKRVSNLSAYYMIRNRAYLVRQHSKGMAKPIALLATMYATLKGILRHKYPLSVAGEAWRDYFRHRTGRYRAKG